MIEKLMHLMFSILFLIMYVCIHEKTSEYSWYYIQKIMNEESLGEKRVLFWMFLLSSISLQKVVLHFRNEKVDKRCHFYRRFLLRLKFHKTFIISTSNELHSWIKILYICHLICVRNKHSLVYIEMQPRNLISCDNSINVNTTNLNKDNSG